MAPLGTHSTPNYAYVSNVESIVQFSSIVQKSLTHLDLSRCEYSVFKGKRKNNLLLKASDHNMEVPNDFVCTEKNCFEIFSNDTTMRYVLNLDTHIFLQGFHIEVYSNWFGNSLNEILSYVLENADEKTQAIRKLLKPMKFINEVDKLRDKVIEIMYSLCTDLTIWKEFFTEYPLENLLFGRKHDPKIIEHFLHYACRIGEDLRRNSYGIEWIFYFLDRKMYDKVKVFLKFVDTPSFCKHFYSKYIRWMFYTRSPIFPSRRIKSFTIKSKERTFLTLLVVKKFLTDRQASRESLQLIWRSIPDGFITEEEFKIVCGSLLTPEELEGVCNFYIEIVGEDCSRSKPRYLKHYCRTAVRRILYGNGKLYEGIEQLYIPSLNQGLPSETKSYLRLET